MNPNKSDGNTISMKTMNENYTKLVPNPKEVRKKAGVTGREHKTENKRRQRAFEPLSFYFYRRRKQRQKRRRKPKRK